MTSPRELYFPREIIFSEARSAEENIVSRGKFNSQGDVKCYIATIGKAISVILNGLYINTYQPVKFWNYITRGDVTSGNITISILAAIITWLHYDQSETSIYVDHLIFLNIEYDNEDHLGDFLLRNGSQNITQLSFHEYTLGHG